MWTWIAKFMGPVKVVPTKPQVTSPNYVKWRFIATQRHISCQLGHDGHRSDLRNCQRNLQAHWRMAVATWRHLLDQRCVGLID